MFNTQQRPAAPSMPGAPPAFGAPAQAAPPAFAPPAAAPQRNFYAVINGAAQLVPEAQARTLDPNTMMMDEAQTIPWTPGGQLFGAPAPAPVQPAFQAPPAQPAFQPQQPAFQQPQQPAFQQPQQPAFQAPAPQQPAFQQPQPAQQGFYKPPGSQPLQHIVPSMQQPFQGQQPQQGGYPASVAPAGLFNGVANASVTRRGNNITGGDYLGRFVQAEYKEGQQGTYVIIEVEIVASTHAENDPINGMSNPIGQRVTIFVKKNQNFDGNIKEIMLSLSPHNPDGSTRDDTSIIPQQETAALLTQPCPFAGQFVYLQAREVPTKVGGKYTRVNWWHCPKDAQGNPDTATMNAKYR